ncbi:MAG: CHAD domain-containing protein [Porticoccaceae bacterium]
MGRAIDNLTINNREVDNREVELKLSLPPTALAALRQHPLFVAAAPGDAADVESTYYDTPDFALRARGIALRLRRIGDTWLQTVKCAAPSACGLSARPEWEQIWGAHFDFSGIADARVRTFLTDNAVRLIPVFNTRFHRETRCHGVDGARIRVVLDVGEILAGGRSEPLCELELELDAGTPADLFRLAEQLAATLPLFPDDRSKAARGYWLCCGATPERGPLRAGIVPLTRRQTPVAAFRDLAESCVQQWQGNVWGALCDPGSAIAADPEYIHQLRVGLRRLRSLLRLFAPALPETFVAIWRRRLGDNARSLNAVRDLDVLCDEVLAPVLAACGPDHAGLACLGAALETARGEARVAALRQLDLAAQGRLLLGFMAALHSLPEADARRGALVALMTRRLDRALARVARRLAAARRGEPARLHRLRIACKQLRYGLDFCAPLLPRKAVARYVKALARVQNKLGYLSDVEVARQRLAAVAGDDPELADAATLVLDWHAPCCRKRGKRALQNAQALLAETPPWRR